MGSAGKVTATNAFEAELHALLEGLEICKKLTSNANNYASRL